MYVSIIGVMYISSLTGELRKKTIFLVIYYPEALGILYKWDPGPWDPKVGPWKLIRVGPKWDPGN